MKLIELLLCAVLVPVAACEGSKGALGPTGAQGPAGATGPEGPVGPAGPAGAQGPAGPQGPEGAAGADGAQGPAGPQGIQGIQGLRGLTGLTGPVGPTGPAGPAGAAGAPGAAGPAGAVGPAGPAGPAGADGVADSGCPGPRLDGVCVVSYNSESGGGCGEFGFGCGGGGATFLTAALTCAGQGADLCTDSQAWGFTHGQQQDITAWATLITGQAWTASFSDNDSNAWNSVNGGTGDDHSPDDLYGWSCCGGTTPSGSRVVPQLINGVKVLALHDVQDTYWSGAARYCAMLNGDICSDSQTALIRQSGALTVPSWTNSHADNDGNQYSMVNGGTNDDNYPSNQYGFACCASNLPADLGCPVERTFGVCASQIHDVADTNFMSAAAACSALGSDLCSVAQTGVLRAAGAITAPMWTNSHSDNDGQWLAFAVGIEVDDNPDLNNSYGYACCVK